MPTYIVTAANTTNSTINTEDIFIEIAAPTGINIRIKEIRYGPGGGTTLAVRDEFARIRLIEESVGGTGTTLATIINATDGNAPAAQSTVKRKNLGNPFALGTISRVIDVISFPMNMDTFSWAMSGDTSESGVGAIEIIGGHFFALVIQAATASLSVQSSVVFEE